MIVAHLSDAHLGYRAYDRQERGRNVREQDVEGAFRRALDAAIELRPGLVSVSGDVFDRPDPPSSAVVALAKGVESLRAALPETPVVMIAGSSDTPLREGGPGALAVFDTIPGVEAAHGEARSLRFHGGALHVLLVPHRSLLRRRPPELRPDPDARWNVLVIRGRVPRRAREPSESGAGVSSRASDRGAIALDPGGWDYVALGYRHGFQRVGPRMAYAGSLERIGPDPWQEAAEEKGFVTADLESGEVRFHPVPGRAVVELARIRIRPGDPEHTARRIREVVRETPGGIDGKIVRMRLEGLPGGEPPRLDEGLLSGLRERALHLSVRVDWPPSGPSTQVPGGPLESALEDEAAVRLLAVPSSGEEVPA
jgi:DNA repair exonuclease SbcCD nuclease subunit